MREHVVLLHGFGAHGITLKYLEFHLKKLGYITHNLSYSVINTNLYNIFSKVSKYLSDTFGEGDVVHFVGQSLGGVVIRGSLSIDKYAFDIGNIIMLGTPNQGAELAGSNLVKPFKRIFGDLLNELEYESEYIRDLGVPEANIGVIVGYKGLPFFSKFFFGELNNDGIVSVRSSRIENDQVKYFPMYITHLTMGIHPKIINQVKYFLKNGRFGEWKS